MPSNWLRLFGCQSARGSKCGNWTRNHHLWIGSEANYRGDTTDRVIITIPRRFTAAAIRQNSLITFSQDWPTVAASLSQ